MNVWGNQCWSEGNKKKKLELPKRWSDRTPCRQESLFKEKSVKYIVVTLQTGIGNSRKTNSQVRSIFILQVLPPCFVENPAHNQYQLYLILEPISGLVVPSLFPILVSWYIAAVSLVDGGLIPEPQVGSRSCSQCQLWGHKNFYFDSASWEWCHMHHLFDYVRSARQSCRFKKHQ